MAKVAVKYHPVAEIRNTLELFAIVAEPTQDAQQIEALRFCRDLHTLAPFLPKLLYENKGRCVPQAFRGATKSDIVTRPEPIECAGLLREVATWLRAQAHGTPPGYAYAICSHAERLEIIAAYLPDTIDPLHWPLVQQAPNPNGEIRVSNLSGLL